MTHAWLGSKARTFSAALLAVFSAFAWATVATAASAEPREAGTIEVTAESQVEVAPDLAILEFGVVTHAPTAAAAAQRNSEQMDAVLGATRKTLGANVRVTTGTYTLRPVYATSRDGTAPKVTGYSVTNVIQLKTQELARLGSIIDVVVQAGANYVQRITFTMGDEAVPHGNALRAAVLKARAEAEIIATTLGLTIVGVHSVVEQDVGSVRPLVRSAMAQAETVAATPIESGTIQVRARVVLTVRVAR
jgi:uncharacterized protein YggE